MVGRLALATAVLALGTSQPAAAGESGELMASIGTGYRHSFGLDAGGLILSAGVGGYVGAFGLEVQVQLSNDHTFKPKDTRLEGRTTSWLNVLLRARVGDRLDLGLSVGPGMGFIKRPGPPNEVGGRLPSQGLHEELRLGLRFSERDNFGLGVRLRVGAEHLWQYAIVRGPEHSVTGGFEIVMGVTGD